MNKREFLGSGWKFPLQLNASGGLAISRYEQSIEESIYTILGTAKGERLMMPNFGCGMHEVVFAPNNPATITLVVDSTRKALVAHEPRIDVLTIAAETSKEQDNLLIIRINYRVRANNTIENLVYPFYITEGS
ncbi:MAG: GPW/gp25 family protein [Pseudomonadota bacterium]